MKRLFRQLKKWCTDGPSTSGDITELLVRATRPQKSTTELIKQHGWPWYIQWAGTRNDN